ncbi:Ribosomal protein L10P [Sesbania bispinosa]|nr:Ribosomal protein L10P [Sesbania bispinosa]
MPSTCIHASAFRPPVIVPPSSTLRPCEHERDCDFDATSSLSESRNQNQLVLVGKSERSVAMAGKVSKAAYDAKMWKLLREYSQVLVISSDNVGSNQLQGIRRALHDDSVVVMGKNSLMKRSIIQDAHKTGNKAFLNLVPLLVGNVALIFTKGDLREVSERIAKYKRSHVLFCVAKFSDYEYDSPQLRVLDISRLINTLVLIRNFLLVFIAVVQVVNPILMCPKYMSYDSYRTCSYMQSGQLPLGLTCCNQQSSQASEPFLVCSKFSPQQHCFLMRSRQFLMTSIWAPFLLLAGNL